MKKLIVSILILLFIVSCSSKVKPQSLKKKYTFNSISNDYIKDIARECFSGNYNGYTRCNTYRATSDTLFNSSGKRVLIRKFRKTRRLSDSEGLMKFYVTSTGGILFNVTLLVTAGIIINEYTGKIKNFIAMEGHTADFSKSQGLIDAEPGLNILTKGFQLMIPKNR